jgi:phosphatidylglycerophosphate synthase
LQPLAVRLAGVLAATPVRPSHVTLLGLGFAAAAAAVLVVQPALAPVAAMLVWAAWFCDRTDGPLARRQGRATAWGAWLDANVDELVDVGLHIALAAAIASTAAWWLVVGFLAGKYLFMHGLSAEAAGAAGSHCAKHRHPERSEGSPQRENSGQILRCAQNDRSLSGDRRCGESFGWLRRAYHLPGNADVRLHLLVAALLTGCLTAELAVVAVYYNLRWTARYLLVARRLGGDR